MSLSVYLRPIALAESPQSEEGDTVRLGGSMVWASRFALISREGAKIVRRERYSARQLEGALPALPDDVAVQFENLRRVRTPIQCGARTVRLDQPQVMGILNVTPDSFSDGGQFMDDPEVANAHASAMLEAGAAIIDVGGESTRPGAAAVWEGDELKRV
ncbi:MAG: dihydropteroate synthase, partial [Novosphingobium sp.]